EIRTSGTVTDQDNEPLIGVSVFEKGTGNGIVTDTNGKYSLSVNSNATIVYSYIGYITQEKRAIAGVLNVTMADDTKALDEVVVVGYGVQKKSSVTGAISQVKTEDMQNRTITRPEQALQGKTASVQIVQASAAPGAGVNIRIRGINSTDEGTNDPLYVVDGRIMSNIGGIDPNDIESIEVLKDAASAAIYGVRAGNGVVLISTKKGVAGKTSITYDFQLTSQNIARIPKVLNSEQYINYMTEANYLSMDNIMQNWDFKTNTDWSKIAFENSKMNRHNLAFQGGNTAGSYYLSLSYLSNNGPVRGDADKYDRYTATVNANYHIKPWLEVGTNTQTEYYTIRSVSEGGSRSEYTGSMFMSVLQLDPLTPSTYTPEELPNFMRGFLNDGYKLLKDENGNYYSISAFQETDQYHPLIMRDRSFNENKGFNVNGTIFANFKPIKPLVVTSRLAYRLSGSNTYSFGDEVYVNTIVNQKYASVNASAYTPIYYQWENFANYTETFGNHNINAMLGASFVESRNFGIYGGISGSADDYGLIKKDPLYAYFDYATKTATKSLSGGEEIISRQMSYFGRLSYDYAGKYFAQVSLRVDAADSSILPENTRWGYFPATSVGWNISRENFMESTQSWMSDLKLRASWGQNGTTANLGGYRYAVTIVSDSSYPYTDDLKYTIGSRPSVTGNPELKWETSEQLNFGLDARFLKNRLSLNADYFVKTTKDLIMSGITPSTIVGNTASPINAGDMTNRGLELELGWRDQIGDFKYSVRGNMATLKNEVTRIHESLDRINGASFHTTNGITVFEKGYPAWYFRGYKVNNIDAATGNPVFEDVNSDKIINDSDKGMIGSPIPDVTYGLTLSAAWKGFDLTVFGTGTYGNDIFMCLNRGDRLQSNKMKEFYDNRWTPENTQATKPRPGATDIEKYWVSDAMVYDGSFFKIKQIQLGYTLAQNWLAKASINNIRAYVSLDDFFTFTKYPGFDPEYAGSGSSVGVDKGYYPASKKVVFGVNLTF
ncbi:MAG: TonB-dependent receptor SusC, partial [Candidatus Ordinivivax streblomastigis]